MGEQQRARGKEGGREGRTSVHGDVMQESRALAGLTNHNEQSEEGGRRRRQREERKVRGGEASPVNSSKSGGSGCQSPNRSRKEKGGADSGLGL